MKCDRKNNDEYEIAIQCCKALASTFWLILPQPAPHLFHGAFLTVANHARPPAQRGPAPKPTHAFMLAPGAQVVTTRARSVRTRKPARPLPIRRTVPLSSPPVRARNNRSKPTIVCPETPAGAAASAPPLPLVACRTPEQQLLLPQAAPPTCEHPSDAVLAELREEIVELRGCVVRKSYVALLLLLFA